eukprot:TRINITY_DN9370_c0_g1_i1.p1 TRINITY_DN9370_c0_g1~~TRINITY_DN9370_c0_g1_i1.p1  ORF type:complete len:622 (+),score=59.62 TRINITY_DN9370_c0_g1_i1:156-2021(+)
MELMNLPPEIFHYLLSVMDTRAMAHLICCNKPYSELRHSMEYWKQIYRREFPKVSLTSTSVDKNDWYLLNRFAEPFDTIKDAIKKTTKEYRTIFISPGLYSEVITTFDFRHRDSLEEEWTVTELIGLTDRKFTNEILTEHKDLIARSLNGNLMADRSADFTSTISHDNPYSHSGSRSSSLAYERKKFEEKFKWTGTARDPIESDAVIIQSSGQSTFQLYEGIHLENIVIRQLDEQNVTSNHFCIAISDCADGTLSLKNCKLSALAVSCVFTSNTKSVFEDCLFYGSKQSGIFSSFGSHLTVDNCVFANILTGVSANNHNTAKISNSTFINCQDQGVMFEKGDTESILDNSTVILCETALDIREAWVHAKNSKFCCNSNGIFSAERCQVTLNENEISHSRLAAVVLRPFSKFVLANNVLKNNNVGLQITHSRSAPVVDLDLTRSQNKFVENQEDISENFKEEDDTDFVKGLSHFDKGTTSDTSAAVKRAYQLNVCTFCTTGYDYHYQTWFECITCGLSSSSGICSVCKDICHKGHQVIPTPQFTLFYCDCGSTRDCKAIDKTVAQRLKEEMVQQVVDDFAIMQFPEGEEELEENEEMEEDEEGEHLDNENDEDNNMDDIQHD